VVFPLPAVATMVFKFKTLFFYANAGSSNVFSASPNFDMWAVLLNIFAALSLSKRQKKKKMLQIRI
jgi:hypothetical protein